MKQAALFFVAAFALFTNDAYLEIYQKLRQTGALSMTFKTDYYLTFN